MAELALLELKPDCIIVILTLTRLKILSVSVSLLKPDRYSFKSRLKLK